MAQCGVLNFLLVSPSVPGRRLLFAIANRNLEAANKPDRAPEIIVNTARHAKAMLTLEDATASTNANIGSSLGSPFCNKTPVSIEPIIMNVTTT